MDQVGDKVAILVIALLVPLFVFIRMAPSWLRLEPTTTLRAACAAGDVGRVRTLLKAGADVNHAAEEGEWDGPHRVYAPPARGWRRRESCQLDWQ
mmetsp:Transcript_7983/g.19390  ORF Transcript_7983/g.19390 Transcript_7983/m.19390 type:complete len:95 (-) Transcript_7983:415-699(-)